MKLLPLLLLLCSCAVDQGVEAEIPMRLPDGTMTTGRFERRWAGGPVEFEATYSPDGTLHVRWKSDVDLGPAERASMEQARAQVELLGSLTQLIRNAAALAAGVPLAPPVEPTREQGGGP